MDILKELASIKKPNNAFIIYHYIVLINQLSSWLVLYVRLCKRKSSYLSTARVCPKKMLEFCSQESEETTARKSKPKEKPKTRGKK